MRYLFSIAALTWIGMSTVVDANALQPLALASDIDGKPVSPEQFRGKVTVILIADQANASTALETGRRIRVRLGGDARYEYVAILDLKAVPSFIRGVAVGQIKDQLRSSEEVVLREFQNSNPSSGITSPRPPLVIPDWDGKLSLKLWQASPLIEFSVFREDGARSSRFNREKIEQQQNRIKNTTHVFIVGTKGDIQAHYLGPGTAGLAIAKVRDIW